MPRVAPAMAARSLNRKLLFRMAARHRAASSTMDSGLGKPHNLC